MSRRRPDLTVHGWMAGHGSQGRDSLPQAKLLRILEDSKVRLVLHRTSPAVSTDVVLIERPKAVFLGRCEPARAKARHRKHA